MIIFGWGYTTVRNYGHIYKLICPHCNNTDIWELSKITTWFTLFFIPIIPYSIKYIFYCPICQYGKKISRSEFQKFKPIIDLNKELKKKRITEIEHANKLREIYQGLGL